MFSSYLSLGKKIHIITAQTSVLEQTLEEFINKDKIRVLGGGNVKGIRKVKLENINNPMLQNLI